MGEDPESGLTETEQRDLQRLAGIMVPHDATYGVPGADDGLIFADILRSLERDTDSVRAALSRLQDLSDGNFGALDAAGAEKAAMTLLATHDAVTVALGRAVLQCYYRDDRVVRSLGLEPRAPFPLGHELEQGDWSLLETVRLRRRMWRDLDGVGD